MGGGLLIICITITNYNAYTIMSTIIAIIVYGIFSTTKAIIQTILVYNYEAWIVVHPGSILYEHYYNMGIATPHHNIL